MRKFTTKIVAALLSVCMVVPLSVTAFAADGKPNDGNTAVTYDESLYVTLDHYGNKEKTSVVKGVNLNGNTKFTDYGSYKNVQNMSGYAKPTVNADSVEWDLGDDFSHNRMYFEGVPDNDNIQVPWSFNVTYKLNGVPIKADKLAGVSGTVEMSVECTPNENVNDYAKNNMMLQLVTLVDTEKVLSVEAEGAQTQSIGKYKAVLFAALPSEAITFNIRIGTNSFSTLGLIMLVEPATLSQMNQLKELREMKETIGDAPTLLLNGMGSMLGSVRSMADSLNQVGSGFNDINNAYNSAMQYSNDIATSSQSAITALSNLSKTLTETMPYVTNIGVSFNKLSELFKSIQGNVTANTGENATGENMLKSLNDAQLEMKSAYEYLDQAQDDAKKAKALSLDVSSLSKEQNIAGADTVYNEINAVETAIGNTRGQVDALSTKVDGTKGLVESLGDLLEFVTDPAVLEEVKGLLDDFAQTVKGLGTSIGNLGEVTTAATALFNGINGAVSVAGSDLDAGIKKILGGMNSIGNDSTGLDSASEDLQNVGATLQGAIDKVLNDMTSGNNLLEIDTKAQKQSFTSEKNGTPSSSQIILRTETIGLSLMNNDTSVKEEAAKTPWARIKQVFVKIGNAVKTLFS